MIDQEFVKYIVSALVNDPEAVKIDREVDERGVLLTLHVADDDLGRVIGRKGSTAQSLRTLLRALGSKNSAHYNLKIMDGDSDNYRSQAKREEPAKNSQSAPEAEELPAEKDEAPTELDQAKAELKELDDDLDI